MKDKFYTFKNGKLQGRELDFSVQDEKNPTPICRRYNVETLFDFFLMAYGQPARMIDIVNELPPNTRKLFPKRTALYNIIKRENFARRYDNTVKILKKQRENEIGMSFEKLDNIARVVLMRYYERLGNPKEGVEPLVVSHKDVATMWQITRTERGLPTNITHNTNVDVDGGVKRIFEKKGVSDLLDAFKSLPKENRKQLLNKIEDGKTDTPKLLSRGNNGEHNNGA